MNADVNRATLQPSEMLQLNLTEPVTENPNRLGVLAQDLQGFPNGRRLTDDVVDIGLQALEGAAQTGKLVDAIAAGDKVDANDNAFTGTFPYVALPNGVGVNTIRGGGGGAAAPAPGSSMAAGQSAKPAAFTGDSDNMMPVVWSAVGSAAVVGLGALFFVTWWRRRRVAPAAGIASAAGAAPGPAAE